MKQVEAMTREEALALTEDEIRNMIDWNCAEEGIKLVGERPEEPERLNIEKDITTFEVMGLLIKDEQFAKQLSNMLKNNVSLFVEQGLSFRGEGDLAKPFDSEEKFLVSEVCLYSEKLFSKVGDSVKDYKKRKEEYRSDLEDWESNQIGRKRIEEHIRGIVYEHKIAKARIEEISEEFDKYCTLAEGDKKLAYRFLLLAYGEEEEETMQQIEMQHGITAEIKAAAVAEVEAKKKKEEDEDD